MTLANPVSSRPGAGAIAHSIWKALTGFVRFGLVLPVWICALVAFVIALCIAISPMHPVPDLIAHALLPGAFLAVLAVIGGLVLRTGRPVLLGVSSLAVAGMALFESPVALPFLPGPKIVAGDGSVNVAQLNMWVENRTPRAVQRWLAAQRPDIAVLVEAPSAMVGDLCAGKTNCLRQKAPGTSSGNELLLATDLPAQRVASGRGQTGFSYLQAEVEIAGRTTHWLVVHLTRPWPFGKKDAQDEQAAELAALLADVPHPRIVLGDFNAAPWGRIARGLVDEANLTVYGTSFAGTWPAQFPPQSPVALPVPPLLAVPIDLAFADSAFRVRARRALFANTGSDHLPVVFNLGLRPDPARLETP